MAKPHGFLLPELGMRRRGELGLGSGSHGLLGCEIGGPNPGRTFLCLDANGKATYRQLVADERKKLMSSADARVANLWSTVRRASVRRFPDIIFFAIYIKFFVIF